MESLCIRVLSSTLLLRRLLHRTLMPNSTPVSAGWLYNTYVVTSYEGWRCSISSTFTHKLNIRIKATIVLTRSSRFWGGILTIWAIGRFTVQIKSTCGTREQLLRVRASDQADVLVAHSARWWYLSLHIRDGKYQAGWEGVSSSDLSRCKCWATIRTFFLPLHLPRLMSTSSSFPRHSSLLCCSILASLKCFPPFFHLFIPPSSLFSSFLCLIYSLPLHLPSAFQSLPLFISHSLLLWYSKAV